MTNWRAGHSIKFEAYNVVSCSVGSRTFNDTDLDGTITINLSDNETIHAGNYRLECTNGTDYIYSQYERCIYNPDVIED